MNEVGGPRFLIGERKGEIVRVCACSCACSGEGLVGLPGVLVPARDMVRPAPLADGPRPVELEEVLPRALPRRRG